MFAIAAPFPFFTDTSGDPLDDGFLFFGVAGQNPETNPTIVYWDSEGTQPASQPVQTVDGYPARSGTPATLFTGGDFSITVRNKREEVVYSALTSTQPYRPSGTGATAVSYQDELDVHIVSSLRFMSEVQRNDVLGRVGTSDVSSPIQKWADYCETKGCTGDGVPGVYLLGATITVNSGNTILRGRGLNTVFQRSGDYGDTFFFTGNDGTGVTVDKVGITDCLIKATGLMTSGYHVHANGVLGFECRNVRCEDGFGHFGFFGVRQATCNNLYGVVSDIHGGSATGRTVYRFGSAAATYGHPSCADLTINGWNSKGPSSVTPLFDYGVLATSADGVWLQNGHTGGGGIANVCLSAEEATQQVGLVFLDNVEHDAISEDASAILLKNSANSIFGCQVRGGVLHGGASGNHGILVNAGTDVDGFQVSGVTAFNFNREAVKLLGGRNYQFTDFNARGNSRETVNTYSGIYLKDVDGAQFRGGGSGADPLGINETTTQKFGIEIDTGCSGLRGDMNLEGNLSGSLGGAGAAQYRWEGGGLEKTPATRVEANLMPVGGIGFGGAAYLDGNALTGIADSKLFTVAILVRFQNAAGGTNETMMDCTGSSGLVQRLTNGNLFVLAKNSAAVTILSQTTSGATMAAAGTYRILISCDLGNGLFKVYINDVLQTLQGGGTLSNDTIDFTVAEFSIGATTTGTQLFTGDLYAIWFNPGVYVDFDTKANRRLFFTKGGVLEDLGIRGHKPTGSQPILFQAYDDGDSWVFPKGSAAATAWTVNGTPTVVTTDDYTYYQNLLHGVTTTAAAHKVGRFVQTVTANRAGGTTTLDLTYLASKASPGFRLTVRTIQAQTVVSGASNVVPIAGGAAGTAILAATAGKFAVLELNSDGSTFTIVQSN